MHRCIGVSVDLCIGGISALMCWRIGILGGLWYSCVVGQVCCSIWWHVVLT